MLIQHSFLGLLCLTVVSAQRSNARCEPDNVSFEMVTGSYSQTHIKTWIKQCLFISGYVYSAPADMLDSQPGTLMLTDCIDTCRRNESCRSINYETGLCVLFSSNVDDDGGKKITRFWSKLVFATIRNAMNFCDNNFGAFLQQQKLARRRQRPS